MFFSSGTHAPAEKVAIPKPAARASGFRAMSERYASPSRQEGNEGEHQEYEEEDFGDACRGTGDSAEAEHGCHKSDDQEKYCGIQHINHLSKVCYPEDMFFGTRIKKMFPEFGNGKVGFPAIPYDPDTSHSAKARNSSACTRIRSSAAAPAPWPAAPAEATKAEGDQRPRGSRASLRPPSGSRSARAFSNRE